MARNRRPSISGMKFPPEVIRENRAVHRFRPVSMTCAEAGNGKAAGPGIREPLTVKKTHARRKRANAFAIWLANCLKAVARADLKGILGFCSGTH
jgi:hypothetical protein